MSDLDQFEKIFCGTWVHDRDENLETLMESLGTPKEDRDFAKSLKPKIYLKRNGDRIEQKFEASKDFCLEHTFKLGEEFESKDPSDGPKKWHNKTLPTMEGTTYKQVVRSQLPAPRDKTYIVLSTVEGDELTTLMFAESDTDRNITGKRIYKRA